MATERRVIEIRINSADAARQLRNMDRNLEKTRRSAQSLERSFNRLNSVLGTLTLASTAGYVVRSFIQMADQYAELQGRVDIVARNTVGLTQAMEDLNEVAQTTFVAFEGTAALYTRLGVATRDLGLSHQDLLDLTQLTADTLRLSGASAKESAAFMTQFSQAMSSGRFAGDEFRSMLESNVFMSQLLADALETNVGGLREMAEAGELTTEVVLTALLPAVERVRQEAEDLPVTVTRAWTNLETATQRLLGAMDSLNGQFSIIASTLQGIAWIIDTIAKGVEVVASYTSTSDLNRFLELQTEQDQLEAAIERGRELLVRQGATEGTLDYEIQRTIDLLNPLYNRLNEVNEELEKLRGRREAVLRSQEGPPLDFLSPGGEFDVERLQGAKGETPVGLFSKDLDAYAATLADVSQEEELTIEKQKILIATFESGAISAEQYREELERLHSGVVDLSVDSEETVAWTEALAVAMGQTLADATGRAASAMVDFAVRGEQSFTEMAQSILESIAEMIIQFTLMRALFGPTGTSGLLGGFFPTTTSANGNVLQGGNVVPFARGGVVNRPTVFPMANGMGLMGEAGPEAIMPLTRDRNGRLGVSGGGTVVNVQNNTGAETQVESSNGPNGEEIIDVIIGQVAGSIATGGPPAQAIEQTYGIQRAGYAR